MIVIILCIVLGVSILGFIYAMGMRRRHARRQFATTSVVAFGIASTLLGLFLSGVIWQPDMAQDVHSPVTISWSQYLKSADKADLSCAQKVLNVSSTRAHQLAATEAKKGTGDDLRGIVKLNDNGLTDGQARTALAQHYAHVSGLYTESVTAIYLYSGKHCTATVFATPGAYLTLTIPSKGGKTFVRNTGVLVKDGRYYVWKTVS
jgi:hypothetical protein